MQMFSLGIKEYKARNFFKAFRLFELGSQSGTKQAQFNLAICYQQGKGTKRNMKKVQLSFTLKKDLHWLILLLYLIFKLLLLMNFRISLYFCDLTNHE